MLNMHNEMWGMLMNVYLPGDEGRAMAGRMLETFIAKWGSNSSLAVRLPAEDVASRRIPHQNASCTLHIDE